MTPVTRELAERDANHEALAAEVSKKRKVVMTVLQNRSAAPDSGQREVAGLLTNRAIQVGEADKIQVGGALIKGNYLEVCGGLDSISYIKFALQQAA